MSQGKIKTNLFSAKKSKSRKLRLTLIFLALILLASLHIWQRITVVTLSTQNKELRVQIKQHQKTLNYMQIEVTRLSSIERIEKIGEEMGLIRPPLDSLGFIKESPDSIYLDTLGTKENVWAKLKALKKNLFSVKQAFAREIKHEH